MAKGGARDLDKEAAWRRAMRAQAGSGLSARAWCGEHGLKDSAFYWWRRELIRRDGDHADVSAVGVSDCVTPPGSASSAKATRSSATVLDRVAATEPSSFVPVHVVEDAAASADALVKANDREACCIEIVTGGRLVRVRGWVDCSMLTDVLDVLERRAC